MDTPKLGPVELALLKLIDELNDGRPKPKPDQNDVLVEVARHRLELPERWTIDTTSKAQDLVSRCMDEFTAEEYAAAWHALAGRGASSVLVAGGEFTGESVALDVVPFWLLSAELSVMLEHVGSGPATVVWTPLDNVIDRALKRLQRRKLIALEAPADPVPGFQYVRADGLHFDHHVEELGRSWLCVRQGHELPTRGRPMTDAMDIAEATGAEPVECYRMLEAGYSALDQATRVEMDGWATPIPTGAAVGERSAEPLDGEAVAIPEWWSIEDELLLQVLADATVPLGMVDLVERSAAVDGPSKTLSTKRLKLFERDKLSNRPNGQNKGHRITAKGLRLHKHLQGLAEERSKKGRNSVTRENRTG